MSRLDMLRLSPLLILLLLSISLSMGLFNKTTVNPVSTVNNGKLIPYFELPSLGGEPAFSPRLFGRRVVVVNVFASWCAACVEEHKQLLSLAKIVNIYGVAWKDKPEDAVAYINKHGNPFQQIGVDESGITTIPMSLTGVPETFVLNKKGEIALHYKATITPNIMN
ncbi:MAG: redoxin family protein, partial [Rickettsiales bacterium]